MHKRLTYMDHTHCRLIAAATVPGALRLLRFGMTLAARPANSAWRIHHCTLLAVSHARLLPAHPGLLAQVRQCKLHCCFHIVLDAVAQADARIGSSISQKIQGGMAHLRMYGMQACSTHWVARCEGPGPAVLQTPGALCGLLPEPGIFHARSCTRFLHPLLTAG
jgi:hypothetical protein